ncbi:hypothetical protein DFP72DRAFT_1094765 [Ephemerocybe angulata]|uniref:Integrase catalytic domain-containing protein n=1 Tax=Ephemerocybe angulata TaxID=980116 RepID=A0A8H6HCM7_9AGAR|nr:hypothetical protein DFP72DRAFT_1094765 [Tulosesus angulatus]
MSDDGQRAFVNNSSGRNQFSDRPILEDIPDLPERLQKYVNQGVFQREIPARLQKDCGKVVSLSYIKKAMKRFQIKTVRRSGLTDVEKGAAILSVLEQDPLGRLGGRSIKEKLALTGVHASRDFTIQFAKAENPVQAANRHPGTRKVHKHGIWSSGPNEEWCVDGHEKIALSMGISVYGIVDKYSRMELALFAVPNARHSRVPVLVYLRTVQKMGGMPLSSTSDKGSELGPLISLVQTLRKRLRHGTSPGCMQRSWETTNAGSVVSHDRSFSAFNNDSLPDRLRHAAFALPLASPVLLGEFALAKRTLLPSFARARAQGARRRATSTALTGASPDTPATPTLRRRCWVDPRPTPTTSTHHHLRVQRRRPPSPPTPHADHQHTFIRTPRFASKDAGLLHLHHHHVRVQRRRLPSPHTTTIFASNDAESSPTTTTICHPTPPPPSPPPPPPLRPTTPSLPSRPKTPASLTQHPHLLRLYHHHLRVQRRRLSSLSVTHTTIQSPSFASNDAAVPYVPISLMSFNC